MDEGVVCGRRGCGRVCVCVCVGRGMTHSWPSLPSLQEGGDNCPQHIVGVWLRAFNVRVTVEQVPHPLHGKLIVVVLKHRRLHARKGSGSANATRRTRAYFTQPQCSTTVLAAASE